jgi:hypothetical protein
MTPEEGYKEAIRRIREVQRTGVDWLDLGDLPIEVVPEEIRILKDRLRQLALGLNKPVWKERTLVEWVYGPGRLCQVQEIGPLSSLTGLTTLSINDPPSC